MKNPLNYFFVIVLALLFIQCSTKSEPIKPNILLICVDDLRPELNSFGKEYVHSPHIDALAQNGFSFQRHFVNAPSCGPSRYTLLTGKYGPVDNYAIFKRSELIRNGQTVDPSMPEWFKSNGYTTVSVGKVSHHPGGKGGKNWNDSTLIEMPNTWSRSLLPIAEWQNPQGVMFGLAHGEIRANPKDMDVFQSEEGNDLLYPDGHIAQEAINQLKLLSADSSKPFFLAVGFLKPHLPFGAPKKYYDLYNDVKLPPIEYPEKPDGQTTWHPSGEFYKYNRWGKDPKTDQEFSDELRKHYLACVSYSDAQVGKLLEELKKTGADQNTIVVLWGDHGWHLGEHGIWGKHSLFEESLRSPLIISYPGMNNKNFKSDEIVETTDIFPTLCELASIQIPNYISGTSLKTMIDQPTTKGHSSFGYTYNAYTLRTEKYRLTQHKNGFVELYDHQSIAQESKNIADDHPDVVEELIKELEIKKAQINRP